MRLKLLPWVFLIGSILLIAGCISQQAGKPADQPPLNLREIPTLTPVPVTPQVEPLTVGFNVRGWT